MSLYQPPHFVVGEPAALIAVMRAHPLATLVSASGGEPEVTHLPLEVVDGGADVELLGHVARANPHWRHWSAGASVTAIFHGAEGYVSPRWYAVREAVPTWNYIVVHARGRIVVTHDSGEKERILKALIDRHDPAYHRQWDELGDEYRERMKRGIVGLTIAVDRLEGKFKLSQNRSAEDRAGVHAGLAAGPSPAQDLAGWMRRLRIAE